MALHAAVPPRSEFLIEGTAEYGLRIVGSATVVVNGASYTIVDSDDVLVGAVDRVTFSYSGGSVTSVQLLVVACDAVAPAGTSRPVGQELFPNMVSAICIDHARDVLRGAERGAGV